MTERKSEWIKEMIKELQGLEGRHTPGIAQSNAKKNNEIENFRL